MPLSSFLFTMGNLAAYASAKIDFIIPEGNKNPSNNFLLGLDPDALPNPADKRLGYIAQQGSCKFDYLGEAIPSGPIDGSLMLANTRQLNLVRSGCQNQGPSYEAPTTTTVVNCSAVIKDAQANFPANDVTWFQMGSNFAGIIQKLGSSNPPPFTVNSDGCRWPGETTPSPTPESDPGYSGNTKEGIDKRLAIGISVFAVLSLAFDLALKSPENNSRIKPRTMAIISLITNAMAISILCNAQNLHIAHKLLQSLLLAYIPIKYLISGNEATRNELQVTQVKLPCLEETIALETIVTFLTVLPFMFTPNNTNSLLLASVMPSIAAITFRGDEGDPIKAGEAWNTIKTNPGRSIAPVIIAIILTAVSAKLLEDQKNRALTEIQIGQFITSCAFSGLLPGILMINLNEKQGISLAIATALLILTTVLSLAEGSSALACHPYGNPNKSNDCEIVDFQILQVAWGALLSMSLYFIEEVSSSCGRCCSSPWIGNQGTGDNNMARPLTGPDS